MYKGLDWEVQKYGHIIRTSDLDISVHRITTKVYIYKNKYYVETWIDDIRYLFQTLDQKGSKNMKKIDVDDIDIIVEIIGNFPYYEIKYKEVGKDYYNIGFGSYVLNKVLKWKEEYFN